MRTCEPVMRTPAATAIGSAPGVEGRTEATSNEGGDWANMGAANARQQATLSRRDIQVTSTTSSSTNTGRRSFGVEANRAGITILDGTSYRVSDVTGRQARVIRTEHSGREST